MKQQYWVTLIDGGVVDVSAKPEDRLEAIKQRIEGTDVQLNDSVLLFVEDGGKCKLGLKTEIIETDKNTALDMVRTSMTYLNIRMEALERIRNGMKGEQ